MYSYVKTDPLYAFYQGELSIETTCASVEDIAELERIINLPYNSGNTLTHNYHYVSNDKTRKSYICCLESGDRLRVFNGDNNNMIMNYSEFIDFYSSNVENISSDELISLFGVNI